MVVEVPIAGISLLGSAGKYYQNVSYDKLVPNGYIPFTLFENGYWVETCTFALNTSISLRKFNLDIRSANVNTIPTGANPIYVICMKQFNL